VKLSLVQAEHGPTAPINLAECRVRRRAVCGGITHEYHLTAAV
jgi:hypothetical protein